MCACVNVCAPNVCSAWSSEKGVRALGTGVTHGRELPALCSQNLVPILCKDSRCSYHWHHLSGPLLTANKHYYFWKGGVWEIYHGCHASTVLFSFGSPTTDLPCVLQRHFPLHGNKDNFIVTWPPWFRITSPPVTERTDTAPLARSQLLCYSLIHLLKTILLAYLNWFACRIRSDIIFTFPLRWNLSNSPSCLSSLNTAYRPEIVRAETELTASVIVTQRQHPWCPS